MARVRYKALVRIDGDAGLVEIGATTELDEADAAPLLAAGFLEELKPAAKKPAAKARKKPAAKKPAPAPADQA